LSAEVLTINFSSDIIILVVTEKLLPLRCGLAEAGSWWSTCHLRPGDWI